MICTIGESSKNFGNIQPNKSLKTIEKVTFWVEYFQIFRNSPSGAHHEYITVFLGQICQCEDYKIVRQHTRCNFLQHFLHHFLAEIHAKRHQNIRCSCLPVWNDFLDETRVESVLQVDFYLRQKVKGYLAKYSVPECTSCLSNVSTPV